MDLRSLGILAIAAIAAAPLPVSADTVDKARTISVSAQGTVMAMPDIATISIGVVTEAPSAAKALSDNSERFSGVIEGIKRLGIAAEDIATSQFQVSPIYSNRKLSSGSSRNQIDGFRVHNTATVTVRDIARTGSVIDQAAELGANNIGSIDFEVSGIETKLDEARRVAMENAIRRAKLYAEAAGATLGDILTISEQQQGGGPRRVNYQARTSSMAAEAPIEPGQQEVGVTVDAVWRLE